MSSKSQTKRHRFTNSEETTVTDIDNPAENYSLTSNSFVSWSDTENITGEDKPAWKDIIRNHGDAMNSVSATRARFTTTNGSSASLFIQRKRTQGSPPGRIVYRTEKKKWKTLIAFTKPTAGTHHPNAISDANRAFVSKARSTMSPANLGVTFGELNETLRMMSSPGRSIVRGIGSYLGQVNKNLARNKRASKAKRREIAADTWLEYSFGWAPLISDTEDLAKAAASMAVGINKTHIIKTARAETQQVSSSGSQSFPGAGEIRYDILNKTSTVCTVFGAIKHDIAQPGNFPQKFGLQLDNWLPTLWELVPWSFAIDYFTGVGDYISSLCFPTSSFQYIGRSCNTIVQRKSANHQIVGDTKMNSTNLVIETTFSPGQTVAEVESFTRVPVYSLVAPARFQLPANKLAYVNLAALSVMRLKNQRRSS